MVGLLLCPSGQLIAVPLADAHGADFTSSAHSAEGGLADVEGFPGLLGRQPLVLFAWRAMEFGDGLFDEVADSISGCRWALVHQVAQGACVVALAQFAQRGSFAAEGRYALGGRPRLRRPS